MFIDDFIENLRNLDIESLAVEAMEDSEPMIVSAIEDQLSSGKRGDGGDIVPPYTQFTIQQKELKSGLSGVTDVVTLFDTGEHYSKLFARVDRLDMEIGSEDSKAEGLMEKYTPGIYQLNEESRQGLIEEYLEERFLGIVKRNLGFA